MGLTIASSGSRDYSLESGEGDPMHFCGVKTHSSSQSIELLARSLSVVGSHEIVQLYV